MDLRGRCATLFYELHGDDFDEVLRITLTFEIGIDRIANPLPFPPVVGIEEKVIETGNESPGRFAQMSRTEHTFGRRVLSWQRHGRRKRRSERSWYGGMLSRRS